MMERDEDRVGESGSNYTSSQHRALHYMNKKVPLGLNPTSSVNQMSVDKSSLWSQVGGLPAVPPISPVFPIHLSEQFS